MTPYGVIREHFDLHDTYVMSNYPIHFAGATAFCFNLGGTQDRASDDSPDPAAVDAGVTVTIEHSMDGATWTPITFSRVHTTQNTGTQHTLCDNGFAALLFVTNRPWVRFRVVGPRSEQGVHIDLVQYPPLRRELGGYGV